MMACSTLCHKKAKIKGTRTTRSYKTSYNRRSLPKS
jgi:hypothetical protein